MGKQPIGQVSVMACRWYSYSPVFLITILALYLHFRLLSLQKIYTESNVPQLFRLKYWTPISNVLALFLGGQSDSFCIQFQYFPPFLTSVLSSTPSHYQKWILMLDQTGPLIRWSLPQRRLVSPTPGVPFSCYTLGHS